MSLGLTRERRVCERTSFPHFTTETTTQGGRPNPLKRTAEVDTIRGADLHVDVDDGGRDVFGFLGPNTTSCSAVVAAIAAACAASRVP